MQFLCNFEAEIFVQNFVLYSSKFSCLGRIRKSYFLRIRRCLLLAKANLTGLPTVSSNDLWQVIQAKLENVGPQLLAGGSTTTDTLWPSTR